MSNLTCLIVEDEPLARNLMTQYVAKVPALELVKACSNPLEAIEILRGTHIDILFLDVQMPEITGITLLKVLQKKPYIILTTAYSEYALEGYELDVMDYLLKPITFERFLKAIEKATLRLTPTPTYEGEKPTAEYSNPVQTTEPINPFIFVKDGTKLVKIKLSDIMYIEGLKDYITIYTPALPMALASIVGGYVGARVARKMPASTVRSIVIAIGFVVAGYSFYRRFAR